MRIALRGMVPLLLLGSLLLAFTAHAQQQYVLTNGVWARSDGPDIDVPFLGNALDNCDFLLSGKNDSRTAFDTMGTPTGHPGFMVEPAQNFGCPSGTGAVFQVTTPGVGGAFTLPANPISRPPHGTLVPAVIPGNPNIIQAETDASWFIGHPTRGTGPDALGAPASGGPGSVGPTMRTPAACTEGACNNLAPFRRFHRSAWKGGPASSYNGQTGRAGANFTWCWGNPGCVTITGGTEPEIVRYTAGPRAFGGTMANLVTTTVPGSLALNIPGVGLIFNILDTGVGRVNLGGRGYADFLTDYLPGAQTAYMAFMTASVYVPQLETSIPLVTSVMSPFAPPAPFNLPAINQAYAFPLTTGSVVARRLSPVGNPVVTVTAMGTDTTTPMGARNIQLVGGALSKLQGGLGARGTQMRQLFLPEPGHTGQLIAGVLALLGVAAWRARRRRV